MVKCPTLPKQTKNSFREADTFACQGTAWLQEMPSINHAHCFFLLEAGVDFCCTGSIRALSDIWHIHSCWWSTGPNTNWHAKSQRKQGELSPVWGLLFNISFVMQPKEQLGIWGREPSQTAQKRAKPTSPNRKTGSVWKSDAQADKTGEMLL